MPDRHRTSFTTGRSDLSHEERLLAAAKRVFEETTHAGAAEDMPSATPTIGRYRILSVLGQGGMGIVYAAEQQEPRRRVALKVIRGGGFVDERYIRLFQREIQTLARLKHPGIAAIYESGCTDDGQHFFAMEMVDGVPLRDFVRSNRLGLPQRLDLFRKLCEAMNYAHQRGVIHRDLKPANVVVEPSGNPKILDFGLARITDADVTCATMVSEPGRVQGTLPYMSPEQARGNPDDIDLRSDVYSLGVILYELMTDELPYETGQSVIHEAVRAICEEEPRRPSRMDRALRGDLETIVLKALAKEPAARYQSAAALAEDLNRYFAHQPVLARPPSTLYQLRKLVRRHRVGAAFLATLFVLLVGFGVWMGVLYRRAAYELAAAVSFKNFMVDVFRPADPNVARGQSVTAREILDSGAERIRHEFAARPELQAEIMDAIVRAYRHLGEYEQAIGLAEEALEIRRAEFGEDHPAFARSLLDIGWLLKAKADDARAEEYIAEALARHRRVLPAHDPVLAQNVHLLATLRRDRGDPRAAERLLREALAIRREIFSKGHEEVAANLVDLADVLTRLGKNDEATSLFREAEDIYERLPGKPHPHLASLKLAWASALQAKGKYEDALDLARASEHIRREIYGDDHTYVAITMHRLGVLHRDLGNLDEAEEHLRNALAWYRDNLGSDHLFVGEGTHRLAWVLLDKGDYESAGELFRQAMEIYRDLLASDDARIGEVQLGLARVALAAGDAEGGRNLAGEALRAIREGVAAKEWDTARAQSVLGECLAAEGRFDEAEPLLLKSRAEMERVRGSGDRYVVEATDRIIHLYEAWGKPGKAAEYRGRGPG